MHARIGAIKLFAAAPAQLLFLHKQFSGFPETIHTFQAIAHRLHSQIDLVLHHIAASRKFPQHAVHKWIECGQRALATDHHVQDHQQCAARSHIVREKGTEIRQIGRKTSVFLVGFAGDGGRKDLDQEEQE